MWVYEKKLQYPVNIKQPNAKLAKIIISQYGGLNGKKIYFSGIEKNVNAACGAVKHHSFDDRSEHSAFIAFTDRRRAQRGQ